MFIEVPFIESEGKAMEPFGFFTDDYVNYFSRVSLKHLMQQNGYMLLNEKICLNENGENPGYPTIETLWR